MRKAGSGVRARPTPVPGEFLGNLPQELKSFRASAPPPLAYSLVWVKAGPAAPVSRMPGASMRWSS